MKQLFQVALTLIFCLAIQEVTAHAKLATSQPDSGSVLVESPAEIVLSFNEAVNLTSLVAVSTSGEQRLSFKAGDEKLTYTVKAPQLAPGRNEVQWKALSHDGHVVEGVIIIVIKP